MDDNPLWLQEESELGYGIQPPVGPGTNIYGVPLSPEQQRFSSQVIDPERLRTAMEIALSTGPGILAGPKALEAPLQALQTAKYFVKRGVDPQKVWNQLGWGNKFADEAWRFEIPDQPARVRGAPVDIQPGTKMSEVLAHPELYRNYPELGNLLYGGSPPWAGVQGGFDPSTNTIFADKSLSPLTFKRTLLHELQHAVQRKEGFAVGGTPDLFKTPKWLSDVRKSESVLNQWRPSVAGKLRDMGYEHGDLTEAINNASEEARQKLFSDPLISEFIGKLLVHQDLLNRPIERYRALAGEQEARLAEKRSYMTPEELRRVPPWVMFKTPVEQQTVIKAGQTFNLEPVEHNPFEEP